MGDHVEHGRRISGAEYDRRLTALHGGQPPMPTPEQDRTVRRRQLDIAIDHRLGEDFPAERREQLWQVQQRLERSRLQTAVRYLWRRLTARKTPATLRPGDADVLADAVAAAYGEVLDDAELRAFLDLEPGERPALPAQADQ
ncbi:MAG: hypothetical protein EA417_14645 [Gammaproteobacteria bacterium]|nr:MAG: hypothetical protein EA417_14645 [Gammaproteobacteria bacterium]